MQHLQAQPHTPLTQLQAGGGSNDSPDRQRRVTVGAIDPGSGLRYGGGGLVLRPGPGALPHSMSERPSSRDGRAQGEQQQQQQQQQRRVVCGQTEC
jgi:hypothetical protein